MTAERRKPTEAEAAAGLTYGFDLVLRGYNRQEVLDYLVARAADPALPRPEFRISWRGYDRHQVDDFTA